MERWKRSWELCCMVHGYRFGFIFEIWTFPWILLLSLTRTKIERSITVTALPCSCNFRALQSRHCMINKNEMRILFMWNINYFPLTGSTPAPGWFLGCVWTKISCFWRVLYNSSHFGYSKIKSDSWSDWHESFEVVRSKYLRYQFQIDPQHFSFEGRKINLPSSKNHQGNNRRRR